MHNHLLPGIDDGSKSLDETILLIQKFKDLGYRKLIFTPHIKSEQFDNNRENLIKLFQDILPKIQEKFPDMEFDIAAEYFLDEHFLNLIKKDEILSFSGNKILFEFSFRFPPIYHDQVFYELQSKGFQPIIAHVERYQYLHSDFDLIKKWQDQGIWIQINTNSLSGHYGLEIKNQTEKMLSKNLVDLLGSDCHRIEHLETMEKLLDNKYLVKLDKSVLKNNQL